jgi:hypothetical protein
MSLLLKLIITRLWPVFVPIFIYVLWVAFQRKVHKKKNINFFGKYFKWVIATTIAITIASFLLVVDQLVSQDESYTPSRVENGKITPSQTERY